LFFQKGTKGKLVSVESKVKLVQKDPRVMPVIRGRQVLLDLLVKLGHRVFRARSVQSDLRVQPDLPDLRGQKDLPDLRGFKVK
jgi:hypothetical protein